MGGLSLAVFLRQNLDKLDSLTDLEEFHPCFVKENAVLLFPFLTRVLFSEFSVDCLSSEACAVPLVCTSLLLVLMGVSGPGDGLSGLLGSCTVPLVEGNMVVELVG